MAHRSDDVEYVRSVVSPLLDEDTSEKNIFPVYNDGDDGGGNNGGDLLAADNADDDTDLPQCKIKRNYSCNLCPFFSQNPRSFLYHSRDVHFDRIKIFECSQCLYASKHSQKLQRHINMIHVAGKNRIKKTSKMVKMERKKEFRPIKPKPLDSFSDSGAPKSPKGKEFNPVILDNILKTESTENPPLIDEEEMINGEFKCSVCNFKNKNQKLMRRHEKIVHLKKRFLRCNKCSYVTHVKARYTKHVKYHSMPMIKCDLCDFRTPYKWNLDRHYKNHCGTGAFQCSKCNFRADIKQSLTVHEMNHHVPPVGQGAIMARKKNKVGASETLALESDAINKEDLELLEMEKQRLELDDKEENKKKEDDLEKPIIQNIRNVKVPYINKRESANNNHLQTDFIHPDDVVPRYGQIYVKNLKCKFCSYKAVFSHEIWRHEKRIHGYIRPESKKESIPKRPPPKLIPIQNKTGPANPVTSPILKIPAVKNKSPVSLATSLPGDKAVNENEFHEMCKKSCLTSSLKDFVSLIGDEEGLKTIPDSSRDDFDMKSWVSGNFEDFELKSIDSTKQKQTDLLKKKNASFFDKLKEKLMTGNHEEQSLFCEICGYESKCLSEAVAHQKRHSDFNFKSDSDTYQENEIVLSGTELSSTRCQHCRQRCKTSTDLINHLKSCKAFGATQDLQSNFDELENEIKLEEPACESDENEKYVENRVFVWNNLSQKNEEEEEREGMDIDVHINEEYQMDVTSIYGTVTSKGSDNTESGTLVMEVDPRLNLTVKKVFKCPHCSFWASTASRFHVHIVGHLNKKPFECSLCLYRSNWRWDITKHIRLKSARDPSHLEAQVNMTDETGRRNYSKYNKYLTMMKVQEPTAESSGTGRRSKPTEATQGNVTERDIIPLPAPPRLTRAPTPGTPHQVPHGVPLRPPPPLKAAHQIPSLTKADLTVAKCIKENTKKTLWKCKKCSFRDSNKNSVLAHVKEHYGKNNEKVTQIKISESNANGTSTAKTENEVCKVGGSSHDSNVSSRILTKTPSYKCGHCQQVSNWKHVIQRHCRLKHNGNALIQVDWKEGSTMQPNNLEEDSENIEVADDSIELISCDICPFTTDTEGDLTAHKLNHVDRPGSIFKCSYCPFYVPSKIAVLEHMEIHGINDGCDVTSLKVDNFDPSECNEDFSTPNSASAGDLSKRYRCRQCPYLSNSRTQFLYHKQFHRPRDAPFKCMYCSYNVSRRHLLHQHLRVHHNQKEGSQSEVQPQEISLFSETLPVSFNNIDTASLSEIPLVWVLRSGNFQKMFKCRWCPHVNMRKINIQEHEKMHRTNENKKSSSAINNLPFKLFCPDCNYTCNNAGVLASHIKVHQGFYGEIRGLVDPARSEADQIRELQNNMEIIEPEVLIKEESNNGSEEAQEEKPVVENESLSSQPENAYHHTSNLEGALEVIENTKKTLSFCNKCPARFFFKKELRIHSKFHMIHLPFRCKFCTYTARQRPHLLAHYKVHTEEYRQKTEGLVGSYAVSSDYPQPKTTVLTKESRTIEGVVWTVMSLESTTEKHKGKNGNQVKSCAKYACHRCPAKFFKSVALQYHLSLHGGSYQHRCKYCDYTVKTYGNLIKHQIVHEEDSKNKVSKNFKFSYEFPICGKDIVQSPSNRQIKNEDFTVNEESVNKRTDPQFGILMHGSPEFIYPIYFKNGKIKEKRYKCHKCPSAFEKRDQYRIHLSLHGSKQKYKCEKCDYSVKYYANYVQHMRKHQSHDEALKARNYKNVALPLELSDALLTLTQQTVENESQSCELAHFKKETTILQERKKHLDGKEEKRIYDCPHCPYVSHRKDAFDSHIRRHFCISKIKSGFECQHCDYSAHQGNFIREHSKIHFNNAQRYKAEAYLKCEKIELWCCKENSKGDGLTSDSNILVFKDRGEEIENRFFPPLNDVITDEDENKWKIYVDPKTGERIKKDEKDFQSNQNSILCDIENEFLTMTSFDSHNKYLIEMVEETCDGGNINGIERNHPNHGNSKKPSTEKTKPKIKRWRGKNWKCKKCPHAFGKRDQYMRHVALHGSNQRHNCDICDYSVKFYTNYVQHMRMHQTHEPNRVIFVKKNYQKLEESTGKSMTKKNSETGIAEVDTEKEWPSHPTQEELNSSNDEPIRTTAQVFDEQEGSNWRSGTEIFSEFDNKGIESEYSCTTTCDDEAGS